MTVASRRDREPEGPRYLTLQDAIAGRHHTLTLTGELDLASASDFDGILEWALESAQGVTLDLSGLTFMDCCGLRSVLSVGKICETRAYGFALVPGQAQVQRLFELTGLADQLPFRAAA